MFLALYDEDRSLLRGMAFILCCSTLFVAPFLSDRSFSASAQPSQALRKMRQSEFSDRFFAPKISLARDPFLPDSFGEVGQVPMRDSDAPNSIVLPPNSGANVTSGSGDTVDPTALVLRAVVLGPASRALIETGGSVRVVAVGDELAGSAVRTIDANGIVLANGVTLRLARSKS